MTASLLETAKRRVVLFDGGLGSELIARGLPQGVPPEAWNTDRPDVVAGVHRSYFEAGADVVSTNSFGGSPIKLKSYGLESRAEELNLAAAGLAAAVRPEGRFVAGSIGPTGKFLKPQGDFEPQDFVEAFRVQVDALTRGGVDVLILETMYDLEEALCGLRAARESSPLPIFATMTFNRSPRGFFTLMGNSVAKCARALEEAGASAVGSNCTLDSAAMADLVKEFRAATSLPIIAQPNAGQPTVVDESRVVYSQGVDDYVAHLPAIVSNGARFVGGCCGTDPAYIRRMAEILKT
jgi:5-methyltetrahydrofolate--homocysteine methyltransferase